jgi:integrase/recombinase XerD
MARASMTLDIHDYATRFAYAERQVQNGDISQRNRDFILHFRDACLLRNVCSRVRLIRVMGVLLLYARLLKKDFDQATREDVENLVGQLVRRQPPYSPETLGTYKAILKGFLTWVVQPDHFPTKEPPALVSWITTHVKSKDKRRLERTELLTPADIQALVDTCHNPRDKAFDAMLWETGCRIAELGNLQLRNVTKIEHGYSLDVNGKTGRRSIIVVSSAPYLAQWLANHPFKDDPEAPLWVYYQYTAEPQHLKYDTLRHLLHRQFVRAGIKKPFHPHIFRHSRATYVLANGIMSEAQCKVFFGWTPDSDMLSTYAHLVDQDANNAILRENNLAPTARKTDDLRPIICPMCSESNPPKTDYCLKCGAILNLKKAYEHQQVHELHEDVTMTLFRILVEKGLIDEAAKAVHEAGLGSALRRLAQHQQTKENMSDPQKDSVVPPPVAPADVAPAGNLASAGSSTQST